MTIEPCKFGKDGVKKKGFEGTWLVLVTQSCPTTSDPITAAHQAPLSMGFSRPEYWSGESFPTPRGPPNPGIETGSPGLQVDSSLSEPPGKEALFSQGTWLKFS